MDIPSGEVSVLLGPSGTGKSVFLKSLIGLLRPARGKIIVDGTDIIQCSAKELYEIRTLFGDVPGRCAVRLDEHLRQHRIPRFVSTRRRRNSRSRQVVMEKLDLVGLAGEEQVPR